MPVDKGPLSYSISVEDNFSAAFEGFRDGLAANTAAWRQFKQVVGQGFGATGVVLSQFDELEASLGLVQQQLGQVAALSQNVRGAVQTMGGAAGAAGTNFEQFAKQMGSVAQQFNALQRANQQGARATRDLGDSADGASKSFGGLATSIQNFITATLAFRAVNGIINSITGLVTGAVDFNRQMESAQLELGALLLTVGQVRDAQGNLVEGAQAFSIAQGVARREMDALHKDALNTGIAFDTLARSLQVSLAPALQAGFNPDQARQFSVEITQAAKALNIAEGQIAIQANQLLSGGSSGKRSRLETALGISSEQLKAARDAGTLVEFLQGKLEKFNQVNASASKTFDGLLGNLRTNLELLAGEGAKSFFEEIKGLLADLGTALGGTASQGFVDMVHALTSGLQAGVLEARLFVQTLDIKGLTQAADVIGKTLAGVATVFGGFFTGLAAGIGDLGRVLDPLTAILGGRDNARELVAAFTEMSVLVLAISTALQAAAATIALMLSPLGETLVILAAIGLLTGVFDKQVGSTNLKFETMRDLLGNEILTNAKKVLAVLEFWNTVITKQNLVNFFNGGGVEFGNSIEKFKKDITTLDNLRDQINEDTVKNNPQAKGFAETLKGDVADVKALLASAFDPATIQKLLGTRVKDAVKKGTEDGLGSVDVAPDSGFFGVLKTSIVDAFSKAADSVRGFTSLATGIVQQFAGTVSSLIVDAFDPTKKVDLKTRFAQFLQQIANMALQTIIQIALASAILKTIGSAATSSINVGAAVGGIAASFLAKGGEVPSTPGTPSIDHYSRSAQFFRTGGRPSWAPASDTIPAWLTPGEWVMRLDAVRTYGSQVMHAINAGLVNPGSLRALVGAQRVSRVLAPAKPAYATGGLVQNQNNGAGGTPNAMTVLPVFVANNQTMETLLNSGHAAQLSYYERNAAAIRTKLGIKKTS